MTHLSSLPFSISLTSSLMEIRALTKRSSSACSSRVTLKPFLAPPSRAFVPAAETKAHKASAMHALWQSHRPKQVTAVNIYSLHCCHNLTFHTKTIPRPCHVRTEE